MAGKRAGWTAGTITSRLTSLNDKVTKQLLIATTEKYAADGEAHMRQTAPWVDRTSNARNGLVTSTTHENLMGAATRHTIVFAHSVSYGIWLEVRWAGRYAVIVPTIQFIGPKLMQTLERGMARIS